MTEAPIDTQLAPLELSAAQLAVIQSLSPQSVQPPVDQPRPECVIVKPARGSRLEALLCLYKPYKEAHTQAKAAYDELKTQITTEVEEMYPEGERPTDGYEIAATQMHPGISISYKESVYLPSGKIREFLAPVYDAFKQVKRYSEVREASGGTGRRKRK